eukprot:4420851-Prymnesium_polylepis.1
MIASRWPPCGSADLFIAVSRVKEATSEQSVTTAMALAAKGCLKVSEAHEQDEQSLPSVVTGLYDAQHSQCEPMRSTSSVG